MIIEFDKLFSLWVSCWRWQKKTSVCKLMCVGWSYKYYNTENHQHMFRKLNEFLCFVTHHRRIVRQVHTRNWALAIYMKLSNMNYKTSTHLDRQSCQRDFCLVGSFALNNSIVDCGTDVDIQQLPCLHLSILPLKFQDSHEPAVAVCVAM